MERQGSKSGCGCFKLLSAGCLLLVGIALVGGAVVWANKERIRESDWYRSLNEKANAVKEEMGNAMELRSSLAREYPAQNINVNIESHSGQDGRVRTLTVGIQNPRFDIPENPEQKAREIAQAVASLHPGIQSYDVVKVQLIHEAGIGVSLNTSKGYSFRTSDLLEALKTQEGEAN